MNTPPTDPRATLAVASHYAVDHNAAALAQRLNLPLANRDQPPQHTLHLVLAQFNRLELRVVQPGHPLVGGHPVFVDLLKLDIESPAGRKLNQPLFKAVGVRKRDPFRPRVLDATAGLGEDAWLLAAAGCEVVALERNPVIHALLQDGLRRAAQSQPTIANRITLHLADLTTPETLRELSGTGASSFDTVYLDPMFPPGRKTIEKKPMRVLREIAGNDTDADQLLPAALKIAQRRVAVKRARRAPLLADRTPAQQHEGKALRFDVYLPPTSPT